MIDLKEFDDIPYRELSKEERKKIMKEIREQNKLNKKKRREAK